MYEIIPGVRDADLTIAHSSCAREFNQIKTKLQVDTSIIDEQYGVPVKAEKSNYAKLGELYIGEKCIDCPVWQELGFCSLRSCFHNLSTDHSSDVEIAEPVNTGKPTRYVPSIDEWHDSGWCQIY